MVLFVLGRPPAAGMGVQQGLGGWMDARQDTGLKQDWVGRSKGKEGRQSARPRGLGRQVGMMGVSSWHLWRSLWTPVALTAGRVGPAGWGLGDSILSGRHLGVQCSEEQRGWGHRPME